MERVVAQGTTTINGVWCFLVPATTGSPRPGPGRHRTLWTGSLLAETIVDVHGNDGEPLTP